MPTTQEYSLGDYAILFQQGDEKALAFIYNHFHPTLAHFASRYIQNRYLAEEIASDALIKTWKMHHKLNGYHPLKSWLYKTVYRDCLRALKNEKKRMALDNLASSSCFTTETAIDNLVRSEVYHSLHLALQNVSPASRRVLIMHYLDGKTTGEIARELSLSPSTVKTQKSKGLETLRRILTRPISVFLAFF